MDASFRLDNRKRKQNQKEKAKSAVGSGVRLALAVVFHDVAEQLAAGRRRPDDGVGAGADGGADALVIRAAGRKDRVVRERLDELKELLAELLRENKVLIERTIAYADAGILQQIRKQGELLEEDYRPEGIYVKAYVPLELYGKL